MNPMQLKLCDIQGRLFEMSSDMKLSSKSFIESFMKSEVARNLDSVYNRMQWAGEEYLMEELLDNCDIKKSDELFPKEVMYWTGYIYRYWSISQKESSRNILNVASPATMRRNYLMFHTMDPEMAIEDLKEINRQKKSKWQIL